MESVNTERARTQDKRDGMHTNKTSVREEVAEKGQRWITLSQQESVCGQSPGSVYHNHHQKRLGSAALNRNALNTPTLTALRY